MTPIPSRSNLITSRAWTALIPALLFWGGMTWEPAISDVSTRIHLGRELDKSAADPNIRPGHPGPDRPDTFTGLYPDHAPLSALLLGAGGLVRNHDSVFVEIVRAIDGTTPIVALVSEQEERVLCEEALKNAGVRNRGVHFLEYSRDSMWIRDYGPAFVRHPDGSIAIVDTSYSAGSSGRERWRDDECPILLSQALRLPLVALPVRLQGGNMIAPRGGHLLTSDSILQENRTRGYGPADLEAIISDHLAGQDWTYLPGPVGELTRHIDMYVSAVSPGHLVVARADPDTDPVNATLLDQIAASLAATDTPAGAPAVHRIPLPSRADGRFRSYCNIAIVNQVVLVPTFSGVDSAIEDEALATLRNLLPGRKVVGIRCDSLLEDGGLLRCVSLGVPEAVDWRRLFSWSPGDE